MGENGEMVEDNHFEVSVEHSRVYIQKHCISGSGAQKKGPGLEVTCMKTVTVAVSMRAPMRSIRRCHSTWDEGLTLSNTNQALEERTIIYVITSLMLD